MGTVKDLDNKIRTLVDNVYFQPPPTIKMSYPCIVYSRSTGDTVHADNKVYRFVQCYELEYIDYGVDDDVDFETDERIITMREKILSAFSMIRYDRHFVVDNLNHDVYSLYF